MVSNNTKNNNKRWSMVTIYSVAHFLVDFACAFLMFSNIAGTPQGYIGVLLYNFFAFAFQMPLGLIVDKCNRNFLFATLGCILVGAAYGFTFIPIVAVVVLGIGNALFHVGGGVDVLNISEKKSAALGIFVSPGAFGIYLGALLGRRTMPLTIIILVALLIMAILIVYARLVQGDDYVGNASFSLSDDNGDGKSGRIFVAATCLFLVVCLRSYVGMTMNFPWKSTGYWGIILIVAVVLGKTLGGFMSDYFGAVKTTILSLGIAAILFFFSKIPLSGVVAVLLFNMTMPITLWAMAKVFPKAKGFSFGLLTFALFLGFLPVYLDLPSIADDVRMFVVAAMVSMGLLLIGLRKVKL